MELQSQPNQGDHHNPIPSPVIVTQTSLSTSRARAHARARSLQVRIPGATDQGPGAANFQARRTRPE